MGLNCEVSFDACKKTHAKAGAPGAPSAAVADKVEDAMVLFADATVDDETFTGMRWATKLTIDEDVLNLIHSLRNEASIVRRKRVCRELLELWCSAIAERQGTWFEKFWGLKGKANRGVSIG